MHKIKVDIDRNSYDFEHPESFNELTQKQYTEIVRLVLLDKTPIQDRPDDQIRLLYAFLGGFDDKKKVRRAAFKVVDNIIKTNDQGELVLLQDFLTKEQDFNRWLMKKITVDRKDYYGPDDRFSTMKFGEFIYADMIVTAYFGSQNGDALLVKLAAVLLREKKEDLKKNYTGDIRIDFESDYLKAREERFEELSTETKQAVLYNYLGLRNWLTKKYIFVFSTPETSSRTNIILGKKENSWLSVRRHLAGSTLNLEKTDQLNLHDVLADLNEEMSKQ